MTDDYTTKTTGYDAGATTDDSFAWTGPEAKGDAGAKAREWLSQLQARI